MVVSFEKICDFVKGCCYRVVVFVLFNSDSWFGFVVGKF